MVERCRKLFNLGVIWAYCPYCPTNCPTYPTMCHVQRAACRSVQHHLHAKHDAWRQWQRQSMAEGHRTCSTWCSDIIYIVFLDVFCCFWTVVRTFRGISWLPIHLLGPFGHLVSRGCHGCANLAGPLFHSQLRGGCSPAQHRQLQRSTADVAAEY